MKELREDDGGEHGTKKTEERNENASAAHQSRPAGEAVHLPGLVQTLVPVGQSQLVAETHVYLRTEEDGRQYQKERLAWNGREAGDSPAAGWPAAEPERWPGGAAGGCRRPNASPTQAEV